uniref:Protein TolB-like n=1 Tax=Nelumbo nucifera TaxID=4432 RepID=A0A822YVW1_NELNU|nr:TPA_asm: hypothetical protein HUJ06_005895 [Nelumbo nucifera]
MLWLNGSFPLCFPDGDLIAFNHNFDANVGIKIVRLDGSRRYRISSDGIAGITFNPKDMDDREDIPVEVKILTREETGNNAFPLCSPDGKFVVFRSGRSHNPSNVEAFSIYIPYPSEWNGTPTSLCGRGKGINRGRQGEDRSRMLQPGLLVAGITTNLGGVLAEPVSMPNQFQPYSDLYVVRLDESGLKRLMWNGYEDGTPT